MPYIFFLDPHPNFRSKSTGFGTWRLMRADRLIVSELKTVEISSINALESGLFSFPPLDGSSRTAPSLSLSLLAGFPKFHALDLDYWSNSLPRRFGSCSLHEQVKSKLKQISPFGRRCLVLGEEELRASLSLEAWRDRNHQGFRSGNLVAEGFQAWNSILPIAAVSVLLILTFASFIVCDLGLLVLLSKLNVQCVLALWNSWISAFVIVRKTRF